MINFKDYTLRKLKASLFFGSGLFVLLMGAVVGINFPILTWIFLILGLALIAYGAYQMNKLRYERENEGARLYHYKGKF